MITYAFLCDRCQRPYRTETIDWHCGPCRAAAAKHQLTTLAQIGEASGT